MSHDMITIKSGATAADRRVLDTLVTTTPPSLATDGFPTPKGSHVHVMGKVTGAGLNASYDVFIWEEVSETWTRDDRFGTGGTTTLNGTNAPTAHEHVTVQGRVDRIAIVCTAIDAGATLECWAGVSIE